MSEPEDSKPTILVVDDTADNRDLIARRLTRNGYEVVVAVNGTEALGIVDAQPIDLIILDIMMPGLTGIDVLKTLRERFTPTELPIVMATAKDQSEDIVEALELGANDYVTKPLDFPVILARVEAQLRLRAAAGKPRPAFLGRLEPGMDLDGKYRLEAELGSGNFGAVFRATHLQFRQPVAVKVLQTPVGDASEALARFRQEGSSAFRLQHPNAVSVLDFSTSEEGLTYLVMELLEGHSLHAELTRHERLSVARCAEIALPICDVLHTAHGLGIIHRDIKPANIFLQRARGTEVVKVLDFGIAKLVGDQALAESLTIDEQILGTPAYMSPERLSGLDYDGRSDVYSLGVMLYQMLGGRPPFQAESGAMAVAMMHLTEAPPPLAELLPGLPSALETLIMRTLSKNPRERPDAADLGRELARAIGVAVPAWAGPSSDPDPVTQEIRNPFHPQPQTKAPKAAAPEAVSPGGLPTEIQKPITEDRARPLPKTSPFDFAELLRPPPRSEPAGHAPPLLAPERDLGEPWSHLESG